MAKRVRLIGSLVLVLLLLGAGAFLALRLADISFRDILVNTGVLSVERRSSAELVSQEVRSLAQLNTVRYTLQRVFPYDFMDQGLSYRQVSEKLGSSPAPAEELLTPRELRYWRAYNVALEVGLDPRPEAGEFIVVSTTLLVGYRLDELSGPAGEQLVRIRDASPDAGAPGTAGESRGRRAEIALPEPRILDVVVQDVRPEDYPYPDVAISPEGWRRVARFVAEAPRRASLEAELFERAEENAQALIRTVLTEAGFREVSFGEQ